MEMTLARTPTRPFAGLADFGFDLHRACFAPIGRPAAGFPVRIHEDEAAIVLTADLPGVRPQDLKVELKDGELVMTALRRRRGSGEDEPPAQEMVRRFSLEQAVQVDAAKAVLEHGELCLTLPKAPAPVGHLVPVEGA